MPNTRELIDNFLNSSEVQECTKNKLRHSISIVQEAVKQFEVKKLAMSFNGGKDCLVMFYIILYVIGTPVPAVYIRSERSFPQLDDFVAECTERYGLDLSVKTSEMKSAFQEYLDANPQKQAIFVGIRRQDPYASNLTYIEPTDHGWPAFTRIQPILDWEYHEIWQFLIICDIPYCSLYDLGYTSIGSMDRTIPNPALKTKTGYSRAYLLKDNKLERSGRK